MRVPAQVLAELSDDKMNEVFLNLNLHTAIRLLQTLEEAEKLFTRMGPDTALYVAGPMITKTPALLVPMFRSLEPTVGGAVFTALEKKNTKQVKSLVQILVTGKPKSPELAAQLMVHAAKGCPQRCAISPNNDNKISLTGNNWKTVYNIDII